MVAAGDRQRPHADGSRPRVVVLALASHIHAHHQPSPTSAVVPPSRRALPEAPPRDRAPPAAFSSVLPDAIDVAGCAGRGAPARAPVHDASCGAMLGACSRCFRTAVSAPASAHAHSLRHAPPRPHIHRPQHTLSPALGTHPRTLSAPNGRRPRDDLKTISRRSHLEVSETRAGRLHACASPRPRDGLAWRGGCDRRASRRACLHACASLACVGRPHLERRM